MNVKMTPQQMTQTNNEADMVNKKLKAQGKPTNGMMGKDAFLKLLVTQLKHQDPTKPMEDKNFIAQMAQFSSLEQMSNLNKQFTEFSRRNSQAESFSLLGKRVDAYNKKQNKVVQGIVDSVVLVDNQVRLRVGGHEITANEIHAVYNPEKPEAKLQNTNSADTSSAKKNITTK